MTTPSRIGVVIAPALVAAGIAVAQDAARPTTSAERLRVIGRAIYAYANENAARLPPSLGYTLAVHTPQPDCLDALAPTTRPAGFDAWPLDRRSAWIDQRTDVLYLQGWQQFDARSGAAGTPGPGTPRRWTPTTAPWAAIANTDHTIDLLLSDGRVVSYAPVAPAPPTTCPTPATRSDERDATPTSSTSQPALPPRETPTDGEPSGD